MGVTTREIRDCRFSSTREIVPVGSRSIVNDDRCIGSVVGKSLICASVNLAMTRRDVRLAVIVTSRGRSRRSAQKRAISDRRAPLSLFSPEEDRFAAEVLTNRSRFRVQNGCNLRAIRKRIVTRWRAAWKVTPRGTELGPRSFRDVNPARRYSLFALASRINGANIFEQLYACRSRA